MKSFPFWIVNQLVLSSNIPEEKGYLFVGSFHIVIYTIFSLHWEQKIQQQISARIQYCCPE